MSDKVKPEGYFHVINSPRSAPSYPEGFTQDMAIQSTKLMLNFNKQITEAVAKGRVKKKSKRTYG